MLPANLLDKKITIQEYKNTAEVGQVQNKEWTKLKEPNANYYIRPGGTTQTKYGPQAFDKVEFTIHYDSRITIEDGPWRIIYNSQKYSVNQITVIGTKRQLKLTCIVFYENLTR